MTERVVGITRVQPVHYYDANRQYPEDTLKKKQEMDFKHILERKMNENKEKQSEAYSVDVHYMPR